MNNKIILVVALLILIVPDRESLACGNGYENHPHTNFNVNTVDHRYQEKCKHSSPEGEEFDNSYDFHDAVPDIKEYRKCGPRGYSDRYYDITNEKNPDLFFNNTYTSPRPRRR